MAHSRWRRARSRTMRAARLPGRSTSAEKRKPALEEGRDGGGVAQVGFGDDARAGRAAVEDEIGDGAEQGGAEAAAAVGDAADEQVDAGVVRPGRVVAGERVEIGAVDLPVAHRGAVQHAEAGHAAAVAVELGAQVVAR